MCRTLICFTPQSRITLKALNLSSQIAFGAVWDPACRFWLFYMLHVASVSSISPEEIVAIEVKEKSHFGAKVVPR